MSNIKSTILEKLAKYFELSRDEMLDLYDTVDTLYNELITKYIEAMMNHETSKEIVEKLFDLASNLLSRENISVDEELILIAILDILATDLHNKTVGFIYAEKEE